MTVFYTYVFYSKEDCSVPTYVGKGCRGRYLVHLRKRADTHFARHLKKQLADGIFPLIVKFNAESEQKALDEEKRLISKFGRLDNGTGPLYNKTDGGEGVSGLKRQMSEETKRKIGDANRGRKQTPEAIEACRQGRLKSEKWRHAVDQVNARQRGAKRKPLTEEHKANLRKPKNRKRGLLCKG